MFSNQTQPLAAGAALLENISQWCGHETAGEHLCPVGFH